jgi:putative transposase
MHLVKRFVTQSCKALLDDHARASPSRQRKGENTLWQRRFWEHRIRNETDFRRHLDYVHFNPVKHNLTSRAANWPYSSFRRLVEAGVYDREWGSNGPPPRIDRLEAGEA